MYERSHWFGVDTGTKSSEIVVSYIRKTLEYESHVIPVKRHSPLGRSTCFMDEVPLFATSSPPSVSARALVSASRTASLKRVRTLFLSTADFDTLLMVAMMPKGVLSF